MSFEKVKITVMGEPISADELPPAPPATLSDYFAPVRLTKRAIDLASKIVPEHHWIQHGLYTWLEGRANTAFQKMPGSDREIKLGRLKYVFEYDDAGPLLKTVMLV
jgi:ABC-type uncharacterized transport system involved in gliding motility auxiliary subunit